MEVNDIKRDIISRLAEAKDDAYGIKMANYMKDHFEYFGVNGPKRKQILKEVKKLVASLSKKDLYELVHQLWQEPKRECQYIAMDLLGWKVKLIDSDDVPYFEQLAVTKSWWDTVDMIAASFIGKALSDNKDMQYQWCEKWIASDNMWLRRTAIIHQLKYKEEVDQELLFALIESQIGSKLFFINKACGWALRQYSKTNPAEVQLFVDDHPGLSNLTKREALRKISIE